jgi:hypothetical protein
MIHEYYRKRAARSEALTSIHQVSSEFEKAKSTFSFPSPLDYISPTPDTTLPIFVCPESFKHASSLPPSSEDAEYTTETPKSIPRLAFTSNNKVVHEYIEHLNRLLVNLDKVESGGDAMVRERRKQMIRDIDAEAQLMDRWIVAVWNLVQRERGPQYNRQL